MKKLANNKKVLMASNKIARAIELETEEILKDAEEVVKKYVPARKVKATLLKIEKALQEEGVESVFDKTVKREALRRTASEEVSEEEIEELVEAIVEAVVDELEEVLEEADNLCDEEVDNKKYESEDEFEIESKLKSNLERKMAEKGVYFKLARNKKAKKVASKRKSLDRVISKKYKSKNKKMTLLERIRSEK